MWKFFLGLTLIFTAILLRYWMYKVKYKRLENNMNQAIAYRDALKESIEIDGKRIEIIEKFIGMIKDDDFEVTEEQIELMKKFLVEVKSR